MRNGGKSSLSRERFLAAMTSAESNDDSIESARQLSLLGQSWLSAVNDGVESNVQPAIDCFTQALARCSKDSDPFRWSSDHYHLAAAELLRTPESEADVERAVVELRLVLESPSGATDAIWASTLGALCAALRRSALLGRRGYNEVLNILPQAVNSWRKVGSPSGLSKALLNAGNAQIDDPAGDPHRNATLASSYFEEAVDQAVLSGDGRLEAACRIAAASALRDGAGYEPDEDLAKAAGHLERAVAIYEAAGEATGWAEAAATLASLQINERARYNRLSQEMVQHCIAILKEALRYLPASSNASSRANALFYLGQALLEDESEPEQSLSRASQAFGKSRKLRNRLGVVLHLACAEEAEANSLADRSDPAAHRRAVRLYRKAIRRLGQDHPLERFRMERNLGFAEMQVGAWRRAARAFTGALKTAEESDFLHWERQGLFREGDVGECYSYRAYCELRLGQVARALGTLESARQIRLPSGQRRPFNLSAVLRSIKDELIVIPFFCPVGAAAVVIPPGTGKLGLANVLDLPGLDQFNASLHPNRSRGRVGWLHALASWRGDQSAASLGTRMNFLDEVLQELWVGFVAPVCDPYASSGLRKLVIVPHGGLQIFPVHAAYREEGGSRRYLATDWSVRYVPSLESVAKSAHRSLPLLERPLAVGLGRYRDPRLRRLALAEAEAWTVTASFPSAQNAMRLHGSDATVGRLLECLPKADTLHFACHATWNPDPERCALQLWADRSGAREELTTVRMEKEIDLSSVRLAVLSACESGVLEHAFAPEEAAGLPGAILHAGCHGVISSLWAVHDLAAFLLWSHFYQELRRPSMPEEALRNAQQWLRTLTVMELSSIHSRFPDFEKVVQARVAATVEGLAARQKPFSHPQLWAPFIHFGD